jgi:cupin fold WbuC family metalloprotein
MIIPELTEPARLEGLRLARQSQRHRYARVLHRPGAYFNNVFNFLISSSYMQPHLHPAEEKIEEIHIVEGRITVFFFNDTGAVTSKFELAPDKLRVITVPAFTWHTYVVSSDFAITYETMNGVYEPRTWKQFADWAVAESSESASGFLAELKRL